LLGIALAGIYEGNRIDPVGQEDTLPGELLPLAIARGDGPYLDRYKLVLLQTPNGIPPWSMKRWHGHLISRYAMAPVLINTPLVAIQLAVVDWLDPGWDKNPGLAALRASRMCKVASALIVALTAVAIHRLLRQLGVGPMAVPATLAVALGSDLWVVASQAPWEHGSAALMLTLSLILLTPRPLNKARLFLGGATTAMMVCCRQIDLVFAIALLLRVIFERPRALLWFLPAPLVLGSALIASNWAFFGSVAGGHTELESLHPTLHGLNGIWSGDIVDGFTGTLFSPNRGLLVFCPWIVVALGTLPAIWGRLRAWSLGTWLIGALVADLLVLSKYSVWWGGHTFGPRYWTDAIPIFAVLLGFGLDWAWTRCRPVAFVFGITILTAIGIQVIGAFCFPSSWNVSPADVDRHHDRVWDWSDNEIRRCLREGLQPWSRLKDPYWNRRR